MKKPKCRLGGFILLCCTLGSQIFLSCSSENKREWKTFNEKNRSITREVGLSDFRPSKPIAFENTGLNFANEIMDMEIVGTTLLLSNRIDSMNLILVNVDDCKVSQKLIKRGKGESECLNVSDIVLGPKEDLFLAFDITLRKVLKFDLKKIGRGNREPSETLTFKNEALKGIKSPAELPDGTFAATSYFNSDCRYIKFSAADSLTQEVGRLPPMSKNWPKLSGNGIRSLSYPAHLKRRTGHGELVVAYTTTPRLEIYAKDKLKNVITGPGDFEPVYGFKKGDPKITENTRFSHVKIKADSDYIYSLYSGHTNFASCANRILVFSWEDSSPRAMVDLGLTVCNFAIKKIASDRSLLFAINADTGDLLKAEVQI